jgi:hypothetical protein
MKITLRELISEKGPITFRDLFAAVELIVGTVYHIVHEEIGFCKVCALYVLMLLKEEHKNRRLKFIL